MSAVAQVCTMPSLRCCVFVLTTALASAVRSEVQPTLVDHAIAGGSSAVYLDSEDWTLESSRSPEAIRATVPGDILTDLQKAGRVPDPYFNVTWRESAFIAAWNEGTWTYTRKFRTPPECVSGPGSRMLVVFDGIRMGAVILLNGRPLGVAANQFQRYIYEVRSAQLRGASEDNVLSVTFGAELGINCGGRYSYSTQIDWAPHMLTKDHLTPMTELSISNPRSTFGFGISKSVYLVPLRAGEAAITQVVPHTFYAGGHPTSMLSDDDHKGFDISTRLELFSTGDVSGVVSVLGSWPGAEEVMERVNLVHGMNNVTLSVAHKQTAGVNLWQPRGHGGQPRYDIVAEFEPEASGAKKAVTSRKIGFRHIALVTVNDTDPSVVKALANGNGTGQFTMFFRVNGAAVYARGANKVPMDILEGRMSAVAHRRLVESAADANFNMLRVWGGGIWEPRAFFDAADELGVLLYADLQYVSDSLTGSAQDRDELEYQIRRLSHHPSIALWDACNECGGLGLWQSFVMPKVASLDKSRPIWPTSPSYGWVSGVDSLSCRPNGKTLVVGAGNASGPRPQSIVFAQESHGPYFGLPWSMGGPVEGIVMPGSCPVDVNSTDPSQVPGYNKPCAVPAWTGPGQEGWFRSEFGCVGWSSFESMQDTMPVHQQSVESPAAKQRAWDPVRGILAFFGKTAAMDLDRTGEVAYKRQIYQAMISQALFMKTEIEAWRSQNLWGTTIWMFNEVWPSGGSWGSIEYGAKGIPGQVEGGRWKPLHYMLKSSTYADQLSTCNDAGACFVTNDSPFRFQGSISIRLLNVLSGVSRFVGQHMPLDLKAGAGTVDWFCASGDTRPEKLCDAPKIKPPAPLSCTGWAATAEWNEVECMTNGTNCIVLIEVANNTGSSVAYNELPFVPPQLMRIPKAVVTATVYGEVNATQVAISLSTTHTALYVVLTTLAEGRFSENAFVVEAGTPRLVSFISWGHLDAEKVALLKSSLRIEHLVENLGADTLRVGGVGATQFAVDHFV